MSYHITYQAPRKEAMPAERVKGQNTLKQHGFHVKKSLKRCLDLNQISMMLDAVDEPKARRLLMRRPQW